MEILKYLALFVGSAYLIGVVLIYLVGTVWSLITNYKSFKKYSNKIEDSYFQTYSIKEIFENALGGSGIVAFLWPLWALLIISQLQSERRQLKEKQKGNKQVQS